MKCILFYFTKKCSQLRIIKSPKANIATNPILQIKTEANNSQNQVALVIIPAQHQHQSTSTPHPF
jgi:hypothetical protein